MSNRGLLHSSKLAAFTQWLQDHGFDVLPLSRNPYERLRVRTAGHPPVVFYQRNGTDHLTATGYGEKLARKFIREGQGYRAS